MFCQGTSGSSRWVGATNRPPSLAMSRFFHTSARTSSGVPKGMTVWVPMVPWNTSRSWYLV